MACVILSNDTFRGALAVRLRTTKAGASDLIGTYVGFPDWTATLGDGTVITGTSRKDLRDKIERHVDG